MELTIYGFEGTKEDLISLLEKGLVVDEIKPNSKKTAFKIKCSEKDKSKAGRPARFSQEELNQMVAMYQQGASYTAIAQEFDCSRTYVSKVIKGRISDVDRLQANLNGLAREYSEIHQQAFSKWEHGDIKRVWIDESNDLCIEYASGSSWHYRRTEGGALEWW